MKNLVILGSSGSIGKNALWVAERFPEELSIFGLAVHGNIDLLYEQAEKYRPKVVCVADETAAKGFGPLAIRLGVELLHGELGLESLASMPEADIVLNGVVGFAGLRSTLAAAKAGKKIALANKESMVTGGELVNMTVEKSGAELIPVDSEHSAIFQCLKSGRRDDIKRLILTSSGGPFRNFPIEKFNEITVDQALRHPTWNMGAKITIDSATLMNKGLEIIEAVYLFGLPESQIAVVVHPQSVVHSMVEYIDGSIIAQMSRPDMRLPIQYALFYPDRRPLEIVELPFTKTFSLDFESPNVMKFPSLALARQAVKAGGTSPVVFNAANEIAVESFLTHRIKFPEIFETVDFALDKTKSGPAETIDDIIMADKEARGFAREYAIMRSV